MGGLGPSFPALWILDQVQNDGRGELTWMINRHCGLDPESRGGGAKTHNQSHPPLP